MIPMTTFSSLTPQDQVVELCVAPAVGGDPDGRNVLAGCGLTQFRCGHQVPDEGDLVHQVSPRGALVRATGLSVLLVLLLRIVHLHAVWTDASVKSGPIAERRGVTCFVRRPMTTPQDRGSGR